MSSSKGSIVSFFVLVFPLLMGVVSANSYGYGYGNGPKPKVEKPKMEEEKKVPCTIGVQGLIYCKSGPKLIPIKGAVARVTCIAVDDNGYESAPFSALSCPTDGKGYFFATLTPNGVEQQWKIKECKAFLENSPSDTCRVPTDFKDGIAGALLGNYRFVADKNLKLYSVGPFVYTAEEPKPAVSNGY